MARPLLPPSPPSHTQRGPGPNSPVAVWDGGVAPRSTLSCVTTCWHCGQSKTSCFKGHTRKMIGPHTPAGVTCFTPHRKEPLPGLETNLDSRGLRPMQGDTALPANAQAHRTGHRCISYTSNADVQCPPIITSASAALGRHVVSHTRAAQVQGGAGPLGQAQYRPVRGKSEYQQVVMSQAPLGSSVQEHERSHTASAAGRDRI